MEETPTTNLFGDVIVGANNPIFVIAGPCVIESESTTLYIAEYLKQITYELDCPFVFKSSFDKANRTSINGYRGLGIDEGLRILEKVKSELDVRVITDVHEDTPLDHVASVVDILQTPAFLCRQTNFITSVANTGLPVNVKKGQFLSPGEMEHVVAKFKSTGNDKITICERGYMFGYNNLVVDMRGLAEMKQYAPVVFDATHSAQKPGGSNGASSGNRIDVPPLARAAAAVGVAGMFFETHPQPEKALSDGPNSWRLKHFKTLLHQIMNIDYLTKRQGYAEELEQ